ncbi:MAG: type 1 glutamine amidotransferase domain-containing protein [Lentisphaeria bacterium]|nr:type 1 glutamine amidotransferase domain-containing protein [Lentisphaeria bacterium]
MKQILIVLASYDGAGRKKAPDGEWQEEFTVPYSMFCQAGYSVFVAAPRGDGRLADFERLKTTAGIDPALERLFLLKELLGWKFDALFYPGTHAPILKLADDPENAELLGRMFDSGRVIGAVSHGPAALLGGIRCDGHPLVFRRGVTGLSNAEEETVAGGREQLRLEDRLREAGAHYSSRKPWHSHVVIDGNLVTGQNPDSAAAVAEAMIRMLEHE